jgi:hypothetical protein
LSNLFRSDKWCAKDLEDVHLEGAKKQVATWVEEGERILGFIDDSSVEKPKSWHSFYCNYGEIGTQQHK